MPKTYHDRYCNIYSSLRNIHNPKAGICTCGYGLQLIRTGDYSQIYSKELQEELGTGFDVDVSELIKIIKKAG